MTRDENSIEKSMIHLMRELFINYWPVGVEQITNFIFMSWTFLMKNLVTVRLAISFEILFSLNINIKK